jgi:F0F1-type ATP synthase alpha subunit
MEENLDALIEVIIEDMKEERLYKEKLYKEKEEIMGKLTEIIGNEIGIVSTIGDGIITIKGLKEIVFGEMIEIIIPGGENILGIILNIEKKKKVSAIIFTNDIDVLP